MKIAAIHDTCLTIEPNHFLYKSLSNWSCNLFVGCGHGCLVCYVPDTSTNKMKRRLSVHGVADPIAEWGHYSLVRPWDECAFKNSLRNAEDTPLTDLKPDGNRAVFFCSTSDPYQVIGHADPEKAKLLMFHARSLRRKALTAILEHSTLNVRILTRSPLAREDFDLMKRFGNRLMLGISLPTLDNRLSKIYEPMAPAPTRRLEMLVEANKAGIPTFAAVAPVYPEVGREGLLKVFSELKAAVPHTIFVEPVNRRLGVDKRVEAAIQERDGGLDLAPFRDTALWITYALRVLCEAEKIAEETGQSARLHLWPDHEALGGKFAVSTQPDPDAYRRWLASWWNRISEWPGKPQPTTTSSERPSGSCPRERLPEGLQHHSNTSNSTH